MWCLRITVLPEVDKTFIVKISDDHSQLQIFFQLFFTLVLNPDLKPQNICIT